MSGSSKAKDDKRRKRIRQRRNAEKAQAHKQKVLSEQQPPPGEPT